MRVLSAWSLFVAVALAGCALSPGQDLPSAASGDESDHGEPTPPVGDGDIAIDIPVQGSGGGCAASGGGTSGGETGSGGTASGGMGGSAHMGGSVQMSGGAETGGACGAPPEHP